jgi:hypothetical protein
VNTENKKSYSIQFKVQRTTTEYGYVSVLVTKDLFDDEGNLNVERMCQIAVHASENEKMKWILKSKNSEMAPIQDSENNDNILAVDSEGIELTESNKWDQIVELKEDNS